MSVSIISLKVPKWWPLEITMVPLPRQANYHCVSRQEKLLSSWRVIQTRRGGRYSFHTHWYSYVFSDQVSPTRFIFFTSQGKLISTQKTGYFPSSSVKPCLDPKVLVEGFLQCMFTIRNGSLWSYIILRFSSYSLSSHFPAVSPPERWITAFTPGTSSVFFYNNCLTISRCCINPIKRVLYTVTSKDVVDSVCKFCAAVCLC